ncbi:DUF342 domain-containing protein [bacterium]|nr:DUF342 domain-containing protein [bacterium]
MVAKNNFFLTVVVWRKDPIVSVPTEETSIRTSVDTLIEGLASLCGEEELPASLRSQLSETNEFVQQIADWCGKMPPQRVRDAAFSVLKKVDELVREAGIEPPAFLAKAAKELGPNLSVSNDQMAVFVNIPAEMAHLWSAEDLAESIRLRGVSNGIDEDALNAVFNKSSFDQMVKVACGKDPVPGKNAKLHWQIQIQNNTSEPENGIARKNHKSVYCFVPVKENQILVKKVPATEGEPGWDVFGTEIPSIPGVDRELPSIPNCTLGSSGLELLASVDGCAYRENETVFVVPALVVNGNVDYESGNIKTTVSVSVSGDVLSEFKVVSDRDVGVEGGIDAARIQSGGSVFCNGGINGKEKAIISAKKNVESFYINESTVEAGRQVISHGTIIQSTVTARRVKAMDKNGQIIGGKVHAWDDVCAQEIGSEAGVKTFITLGEELPRLQEAADKFHEALLARKSQKTKFEEMRGKLQDLAQKPGADEKVKKDLSLIQKKLDKLEREIGALAEKAEEVQRDLSHSETSPRMVRAQKGIYPGTVIRMLGKSLNVREKLGSSTITFRDGKIVTLAYQEREDDDDASAME